MQFRSWPLGRWSLILCALGFLLLLRATDIGAQDRPEIAIVPAVGHASVVNSVAISGNGVYVISGSADQTVRLWETASGHLIRSFKGSSEVNSVAFSPTGIEILS